MNLPGNFSYNQNLETIQCSTRNELTNYDGDEQRNTTQKGKEMNR